MEIKEDIVKWTPKMSVGEKNIDNQHKRLINELTELHSNLQQQSSLSKSRELIHFLDKHIPEHFTYEEAYMEKNKYPKSKEHHYLHEGFINFFEKFKMDFNISLYSKPGIKESISVKLDKLIKECEKFLNEWAKRHIMTADKAYADYIRKNEKSKSK